jgi:DNA-binding MarR family transcriptional regulator
MATRAREIHRAIEALQRLASLFAERRRTLAREAGVSEAEWQILEDVARERFMPSLFARRRACTPAAVSRILRRLQDAGMVSAAIGSEDARQRVYRLTPGGRRVLARLRASRERAIGTIWTRFSRAELDAFTSFAGALADGMEGYQGAEGGAASVTDPRAGAGRRAARGRAAATRPPRAGRPRRR